MWPRAFVNILDLAIFELFSFKTLIQREEMHCLGRYFHSITVHFSLLMGAIILGQGTSLCTFHY